MAKFERPALPLTGGCPCGAVRFEVRSMPLLAYACHCTDCQRRSGASFALNMAVLTPDFSITQGQPKAWPNVSGGGVEGLAWFCGDCGGRIYGERPDRPQTVTLRAGALDNTTWVRPAAHFWTSSAQPWERFPDDALCYERQPPDGGAMQAAWKAMFG
ncbi:MAG TPA: GFA family protein [Phenylobacterium sp.]